MENKLYRLVFLTMVFFFAVGAQAQRRNSRYVEYINKLAKNYKGDIYYLSVNPVEESKAANNGYSIKNSDIEKFNSTLKSGLKNVTYLDSYNYLKNNGFSTTDGIHYDKNTYQKIYNYINSNVK